MKRTGGAAVAHSLADGLMVAPELWARLQALAAQVLVAATGGIAPPRRRRGRQRQQLGATAATSASGIG
ncbi:MAG: hypothetical protein V3V34_05200 [Kiloniellales bacterium]